MQQSKDGLWRNACRALPASFAPSPLLVFSPTTNGTREDGNIKAVGKNTNSGGKRQ